jgi:hypothetical protein
VDTEPTTGLAILETKAGNYDRRSFMNTLVSLPIAAVVPVASPALAAFDSDSVAAQISRLEKAIDLLRTRHVREGWQLDEEGARHALQYFRAGCPDDEDQTDWTATIQFINSHGISWDWLLSGDVAVMICGAASHSPRASRLGTEADPIFSAIDDHRKAAAAYDAICVVTDDLEEAIPKEKRRTRVARLDDERKIVETDDPRWIAHEVALADAGSAESDAECDLATVAPTTLQGIVALMKYATEVEERGCAWPTDLYDPEEPEYKLGRSWHFFMHRNVVRTLEDLEGMAEAQS